MGDVSVLERALHDLSFKLSAQDDERLWSQVESTSQVLANVLRSQDGPVDNHTLLGQTSLPQSIKQLLNAALKDAPIPSGVKETATLELIRVAANFCIDNNENRSHLLEESVIQLVLSLLEAYSDKASTTDLLTQLELPELKLIRTALGALLNASLGHDEVKNRLNSLEAGQTTLRLVSLIYLPCSWSRIPKGEPQAEEDLNLRSTISSWGWRLVSELRNVKDELQIFSVDVLPLLTPPLSGFIPPFKSVENPFFVGTSFLATLVERDLDILDDVCTLIESLALDVEDIRLALARGFFFAAEHSGVPCLSIILDFVEQGDLPPAWNDPQVFSDADQLHMKKKIGTCKAALVKAVVEVAGEEKSVEILWDNSDAGKPGGSFVYKMVNWIKAYVKDAGTVGVGTLGDSRDDLIITASLSLGNLCRRDSFATALLSPPYELAPALASRFFLSPETDLKLKHAVIGFLKNLAQYAKLSPVIRKAFGNSDVVHLLQNSNVWKERPELMVDLVQLNAIGVVKHLCNADVEHTLTLTIPTTKSRPFSGLDQILDLVKRTDSTAIKSEGSRVLVNVIRSLWTIETSSSLERQRKREEATRLIVTERSAETLAALLVRSGRFPALVNESILALTLLSMHRDGAQLVLKALSKDVAPTIVTSPTELFAASPTSDVSSPAVTSPSSARPKLHVPRHALDMLIFVLRNVDNPANYPQEIRINVCSLLLQLTRHTPVDDLKRIKEAMRSTLEKLTSRLQSATDKDELLRVNTQEVLSEWS